MSNVYNITQAKGRRDRPAPLPKPLEPCPETIALLEDMLARATRGEITAVAVITCTPDDEVGCCYTFGTARVPWAGLIAGSVDLQQRIMRNGDGPCAPRRPL